MHRLFHRLLTLALAVLFALPAEAQYTRDAAGSRKIDEAINTHYLATDFDKAEAVLTGTIKACEDKCSPQTLARAWMYVGIVRGSGRNDQTGAKEAFQSALALDPNVKLDSGLATPETQATFNNSGGGGAVETPVTPAAPAAAAPAADAPAGDGLNCTPSVTEIQTRRPVPVQCTSDEEVTQVELRYKAFGSETWKTLRMEHKGQSFRAQIPCDATTDAGILKLYVTAKNATGATAASWGTKGEPIEFSLAEETAAEPPSFDDADAPPRCAAKEICPPDFPGCDSGKSSGGSVDWGGSCDNSGDCKSGLLCMDGTCETAPSCSTTADCPAGTCEDGKCSVAAGSSAKGPYKKWWFGLHVAQDIAFVGGDNVCTAESQANDNFACYLSGSREQVYDPAYFELQTVGKIPTGTVAATTRFLLSVERAFTANIRAGLRLGYAIGGGPPGGRQVRYKPSNPNGAVEIEEVVKPGQSFLPIHVEVRGSYWFGNNALAKPGLRPYVVAGGGLAQVDAKVVVNVRDRDTAATPNTTADAWKKLGQGFITVGGGAMWAFGQKTGLVLNLNAMYMLGASGLVLQPSLGFELGL